MNRAVLKVSQNVSNRLVSEGAEAVIIVGSWVRGDAYSESDIDVYAIGKKKGHRLQRYQDFLISVCWTAERQERRNFRTPSKVGAVIPAWRNAVIIYDPKGIAKRLKQAAKEWKWNLLNRSADEWIAEEITGWAEEVHKMVGNLRFGHRHAAAVQRSLLAIHMAPILAVHYRILYETENRLWDLVSARTGVKWKQLQSAAFGENGQDFEDTCRAALQLYVQTSRKVKHLLDEQQFQVVAHACEIASHSLGNYSLKP